MFFQVSNVNLDLKNLFLRWKKIIKWSEIGEREKKIEEAWRVWKDREDNRRIKKTNMMTHKNINYHTTERDKKTGRLIERKREREREKTDWQIDNETDR